MAKRTNGEKRRILVNKITREVIDSMQEHLDNYRSLTDAWNAINEVIADELTGVTDPGPNPED